MHIKTLSITTLSITSFSIAIKNASLVIMILSIMASVANKPFVLSVIMLNVVAPFTTLCFLTGPIS